MIETVLHRGTVKLSQTGLSGSGIAFLKESWYVVLLKGGATYDG